MKYALSTMGLQSLIDLIEIYILLHRSGLSLQAVKNDHRRPKVESGIAFQGPDLETRSKENAVKQGSILEVC
jgi:hypothetical protein